LIGLRNRNILKPFFVLRNCVVKEKVMRALELPKEVFQTIKREWQELIREEKLAGSRFRQASERFEKCPTKDNMDELVRRAREYSMRKMRLKKFETED
jgi:hypothetical protein